MDQKKLGKALYKLNKIAKNHRNGSLISRIYSLKEYILEEYGEPTGEYHRVHHSSPIFAELFSLGEDTFHGRPFDLEDVSYKKFREDFPELSNFNVFSTKKEIEKELEKKYRGGVNELRICDDITFSSNERGEGIIFYDNRGNIKKVPFEKLKSSIQIKIRDMQKKEEEKSKLQHQYYKKELEKYEKNCKEVQIPKVNEKGEFDLEDKSILEKVCDDIDLDLANLVGEE